MNHRSMKHRIVVEYQKCGSRVLRNIHEVPPITITLAVEIKATPAGVASRTLFESDCSSFSKNPESIAELLLVI